MYLKIHERDGQKIVAACDKELIGKILEDEEHYLDLRNYSSFYKGNICNEKELGDALSSFTSANLIGHKTVSVAIRKNLVSKKDIILIKNFPYIQIYRV